MFIKDKFLEKVMNNKMLSSELDNIKFLFEKASEIGFAKFGRTEMYTINNNKYPRCTSVMAMDGSKATMLSEWAKKETVNKVKELLIEYCNKPISMSNIDMICELSLKESERQRDEAANVGTDEHNNIENCLNGLQYNRTEQFLLFENVWKKEGATLVATEMPLIWATDNSFGFGGRLDILAYKNGSYIIYDLKTSKSVHQGYALQLSAYKNAVEQMSEGRIKIDKCKIIHIPNISTLKDYQLKQYNKLGNLVEINNLDIAFEHYKILLNQYQNRNNKYF